MQILSFHIILFSLTVKETESERSSNLLVTLQNSKLMIFFTELYDLSFPLLTLSDYYYFSNVKIKCVDFVLKKKAEL